MNKISKRAVCIFAAFFLLLFYYSSGNAQHLSKIDSAVNKNTYHPIGSIRGKIIDAENRKPVDYARVVILDINRFTYSNDLGEFEIDQIKEGDIELSIFRIGYEVKDVSVAVQEGKETNIIIELKPQPITSETVIVRAKRDDNAGIVGQSDYKISGDKLRQSLGTTLAKTVDGEPGMSMRSMGPAPARPVLRGLGGDRLLILEDGQRTGDLSATSNDHAVAIDPLNADEVEIYRGPEALQFGSNTIAGVINVWNRSIATKLPEAYSLTTSLQTETVNWSRAAGFSYQQPINNWVISSSASARGANDIHVPDTVLKNTGIENYRGALGVSYIKNWGYIGISGSYMQSSYGIPGGFIGAHPNGVDIDMKRNQMELKSSVVLDWNYWHHIDADFNLTDYYHQEFEGNGLLGVEFGVVTYTSSLSLHSKESKWGNSTIGIWGSLRDYANAGYSFTPDAIEQELAGYVFHEKIFSESALKFSLRYDMKNVNPSVDKQSRSVGHIRDRFFNSWSGAVDYMQHINSKLDVGFRAMRTFRAPGLEELFSEGPHLAAYSFEVGWADNTLETAINTELYAKWHDDFQQAQLNVYSNRFSNYLFPKDTDSLNIAQLLPIYRFTGQDAWFWGVEALYDVNLTEKLSSETIVSYTWAQLLDDKKPVPFVPPLSFKTELNYKNGNWNYRVLVKGAASQTRLGEFEEETDGYIILGGGLTYSKQAFSGLHMISIQVENALNTEYRNHLSRVKSVMPEPGRNISVLYRVYF
ncbi:TonB-dependent receptor [bacterium]|nr:MAG: TonB-dependent receptor [bacterium]